MEDLVAGDSPEISVIMLTYNRENYVGRMIQCILGQTFQNFEFIIVDNGSSDNSGKIADAFARQDQRIRILHRSRGNIGSGRNAGLAAAVGRYIAFVDDDDTCTPDYLEFLYYLLKESNADIAICGATWCDRDERCVMGPEQALEMLFWRKNYNVAFPTKLFRRELFEHERFREDGRYDDIYLMPRIISEAAVVAYHGRSKYHFERHGNNNSAWTQNYKLLNAETLYEYLKVYQERTAWLSEKFPNGAGQWNYFNWSFMISMIDKITRFGLVDCYAIRDSLVARLKAVQNEFCCCPWIQPMEKKWVDQYIQEGAKDEISG